VQRRSSFVDGARGRQRGSVLVPVQLDELVLARHARHDEQVGRLDAAHVRRVNRLLIAHALPRRARTRRVVQKENRHVLGHRPTQHLGHRLARRLLVHVPLVARQIAERRVPERKCIVAQHATIENRFARRANCSFKGRGSLCLLRHLECKGVAFGCTIEGVEQALANAFLFDARSWMCASKRRDEGRFASGNVAFNEDDVRRPRCVENDNDDDDDGEYNEYKHVVGPRVRRLTMALEQSSVYDRASPGMQSLICSLDNLSAVVLEEAETLDDIRAFVKALALNTSVRRLRLCRYVDDEVPCMLLNAFITNTYITALYFDNCGLQNDVATTLAALLTKTTSLRTISIRSNNFSRAGMHVLVEALRSNTSSVTTFKASGNMRTPACSRVYMELLTIARLTDIDIDIDERRASSELVQLLSTLLAANTTVTSLRLFWSGFTSTSHFVLLAHALTKNRTLKYLCFGCIRPLTTTEVGILEHVFSTTSLTAVQLLCSFVDVVSAQPWTTVLQKNRRLVCLDVHSYSARVVAIERQALSNAVERLKTTLFDMIRPGSVLFNHGSTVYTIIARHVAYVHKKEALYFYSYLDRGQRWRILNDIIDEHVRFVVANWQRLSSSRV